jgi:RNA polymerase sigma-32 factor
LEGDQIARILLDNLKVIEPKLNEKERMILHERLLSDSPVTLREIGERFGVTRERVRQIEARLLTKIREHLAEQIDGFSRDWIPEK